MIEIIKNSNNPLPAICILGLCADESAGIYAFIRRDIGSYMLLKNQFVFFDFEDPVVFFILDYIAAMGVFVCAGYYLSEGLKKIPKKSDSHNQMI